MRAIIRNLFDAGGYSLAEMTRAINILPNLYTRLVEIGPFSFEGISQRSVIIEQFDCALNLLPSLPLGAPAIIGAQDTGPLIRSASGFWLAIPLPAAGRALGGKHIPPCGNKGPV